MTPSSRPRVPWSHWDKFLMVTLGVIIVLVFSLFFWLHILDTNPTVSIPNPVMPTQNARDYYIEAANEVIDTSKIALVNWQPPPSIRDLGCHCHLNE